MLSKSCETFVSRIFEPDQACLHSCSFKIRSGNDNLRNGSGNSSLGHVQSVRVPKFDPAFRNLEDREIAAVSLFAAWRDFLRDVGHIAMRWGWRRLGDTNLSDAFRCLRMRRAGDELDIANRACRAIRIFRT